MTEPSFFDDEAARVRAIFDHAFQFMGLLSPDGTVLAVNPAALNGVGVQAAQVIGKPFWQTPWWSPLPASRARLKAAIARAGNGEFVRFETVFQAPDGSRDDIDFSLTPIRDASGRVVYVLPEGRPITALKQALAQAAENERRFRELAELLPETVFEMDTVGRFTYVNQKALTQFGYRREDFEAGAHAFDMITAEDRERAARNMARALAGDAVYHSEYTCLRRDGTTFPGLFYTTVRYLEGKAAAVLGIIIDNSHQKALANSLREWETRYRIATEAGLTGVWDHDLRSGKLVIDANLKKMLGFDAHAITRWDAWQPLFHPDDVAKLMARSRDYVKGRIPRYEARARINDPQGRVRWLLIRATAERDADGWVRRMIGSATDITRLRAMEMALERARDDLEARVKARTRQLTRANTALRSVVREKVKAERALKAHETELRNQTRKLQDLNTALRFLLRKMDREKRDMEEKLTVDLRDLVHPYLKKMIRRAESQEMRALATILQNHLMAIVAPFSRHLTAPSINLTPAELNVALMVRGGSSTREIAEALNVAYKTVETHRVNIRKKLGLTGKGSNLRTYLMGMDGGTSTTIRAR